MLLMLQDYREMVLTMRSRALSVCVSLSGYLYMTISDVTAVGLIARQGRALPAASLI
jgi:hypothetical protein